MPQKPVARCPDQQLSGALATISGKEVKGIKLRIVVDIHVRESKPNHVAVCRFGHDQDRARVSWR